MPWLFAQELEDFLGSAGAYLENLDLEDAPLPAQQATAGEEPGSYGNREEEEEEEEEEGEVARSPSSTTSFGPTVSSRTHSPERCDVPHQDADKGKQQQQRQQVGMDQGSAYPADYNTLNNPKAAHRYIPLSWNHTMSPAALC